jgi:uncharacterized protein YjbI with pentapeptide repeats
LDPAGSLAAGAAQLRNGREHCPTCPFPGLPKSRQALEPPLNIFPAKVVLLGILSLCTGVTVATPATQNGDHVTANLSLGTSVLLFAYVAIAALKQSDAELVLPSSTFDLGGLLDRFKDGIPGGAFVAPILQVKIPLYMFYTLGPLLLVGVHAILVFQPKLLLDAAPPLRLVSIWLPAVAIAVIIWRFRSYVAARPDPPLSGLVMEALQRLALLADSALVIFSLIFVLADRSSDLPGESGRRTAALLRAGRYAGLIWLAGLLPADAPAAAWPLAAALLTIWLCEGWLVGTRARTTSARPWYRPTFTGEDLDMQWRIVIASLFLGLMAFPALGRGVDLSGESLVARAPTETMMAALIVAEETKSTKEGATGAGLAAARQAAWIEYGRGIELDRWRFEHARFDRAIMANIRLRDAKLHSASLDYSNLIRADLTRADLSGASLRYTDMREISAGVDISKVQLAQNTQTSTGSKAAEDPCNSVKPEDRTDFSQADMTGADLTDADLRCSILRGVTMDAKTILAGTKLDGANLCGSNLSGVDLSGVVGAATANFAHSDLTRATIPENMLRADLEGTFVAGTRFKDKTTKRSLKSINGVKLNQGKADDLQKRLSDCEKTKEPGK